MVWGLTELMLGPESNLEPAARPPTLTVTPAKLIRFAMSPGHGREVRGTSHLINGVHNDLFAMVDSHCDHPRFSRMRAPVVLHVSFVLVLSAVALASEITPRALAITAGAVAIAGAVRGYFVIRGIARWSKGEPETPHWSDVWCYGVIPTLFYLLLAVVAAGFWTEQEWAVHALPAVIIALLLITIRNEWDLVIWLAPKPDSKEPGEGRKE